MGRTDAGEYQPLAPSTLLPIRVSNTEYKGIYRGRSDLNLIVGFLYISHMVFTFCFCLLIPLALLESKSLRVSSS